jgi:hypothetical protein
MEAFVYAWTDHKRKMLYIGFHKGSIDDGYICSSKRVLAAYKNRPHDFSRSIIAMGAADDMYALESALLKAARVRRNPHYYNVSENEQKIYMGNIKRIGHTPWNKGKKGVQRAWNKGLPKEQQPKFGKVSGMAGKKQSQKNRDTARITRLKLNEIVAAQPPQQCPHCDYLGYYTTRWHWDNCNNKGGC